jgi:Domain of unknown function (DUF6754)
MPDAAQMQIFGLALIGLFVFFLFIARVALVRFRPLLRPLSGYQALPGQLSRAVEAGQSLHLSLGTGSTGGGDTVTTLAGLAALESLAEEAAATDAPPIVTVADPTTLVMAQDVLRRAYIHQGNPRGYNPRSVRYVAASPLPYAAGVMEILSNEDASANVMAGVFGPEAAFIADEGSRQGLTQVAGAADPTPLAVLYPATHHLLIGEEMFAAGGYIGDQPARIGSLMAQDWMRWILVGIILTFSLITILGGPTP